jgi:hypothetical protein
LIITITYYNSPGVFIQIFTNLKLEIGIFLRNINADIFYKIVEFAVLLVRRVLIKHKEKILDIAYELLFFQYVICLTTINGLKMFIFCSNIIFTENGFNNG